MIRLAFTSPLYLWYLLAVPLLIATHFLFLRRSRSKAIRFANFEALQRVTSERIFTRNYTVLVLRVIILTSLVLAISGMTFWYQGRAQSSTFVIAIDVSASMAAQDIEPTRLDAAKTYALTFVDSLKSNAEIGVVSFSGIPFISLPPTNDKAEVRAAIENLQIINAGGTDIAGAIITSTNLLSTAEQGRTIILMTDGSTTAGYLEDDPVIASTRYAIKNNVRIDTIGIGSLSGPIGYLPSIYNISSVYEEEDLKYIANNTGGMYAHATSNEDIQAAYASLASTASTAWLKRDLSPLLLLTGILFLFIEWGLINTRFKRVP